MVEVKEAPKPKATNGQGQKKETAPPATTAQKAHASPFALVGRFAEEMDRLFEDFGLEAGWFMPRLITRGRQLLGRKAGEMVPTEWTPRIEVLEREGKIVIRAELPGMAPEDVKVEVVRGYVTLEGERKEEKKEEREGYYYGECRYGSFYRAIPLPEGVDTTKATAEFGKGILEIVMPRTTTPEAQVRRLEIHEAK